MDKNTSDQKQSLHPFIIAIVLAGGIFLGYIIGINGINKPSVFTKYNYNKIDDILDYIEANYVDSVNRYDIEEKAIAELLADLDPHSYYIPAEETQSIAEDMQGNFEGIGVQFRIVKDTILIENTIEGGPSEKVGIQAGDKIVFVGDSLIAGVGVSNADVMLLLKGPRGTKVNIKVLRKGKLIPFSITRDKIPLYSVDASYMLNKTTGYIKVNRFAATTYDEFVAGVQNLQKEGMEHLVLDLRGNPGGYLQAAVEMTDEFLEGKKLVVYTEGLHQDKYEYITNRKGVFEEGKLVVLIDQNSASASEIMAGAIQDWDRGVIIGRRSFGKGLVQDQHEFPDKSALRLTIARYFTPTGRSIQKSYEDKDAYFNEVDFRYENGELLGLDSTGAHQDTVKYYTLVKKREVYGGGGITPDVFMPLDTSYANLYVAQLRQYILPFLYDYVESNRTALEKYNVASFTNSFKVDAKLFGEFQNFARLEGYSESFSSNAAYNEGLQLLIKANLAKQLFQNEGFYRVINSDAPIIKEALKQIKK
jgi:carboxyl-terminal processing protease